MNIFYAHSYHQNQKESDGGMWSFCLVLFFTLSAKAGMEIGWVLVSRAPLLLPSSHRLSDDSSLPGSVGLRVAVPRSRPRAPGPTGHKPDTHRNQGLSYRSYVTRL